jgi:hypothetical protein
MGGAQLRTVPFAEGEMQFQSVLRGSALLTVEYPPGVTKEVVVVAGDAWALPPKAVERILADHPATSEDFTVLEVWMSAKTSA